MKKIKTVLTTAAILAAVTSTTYAAEIPIESAPENATAESIAITENLISPILDEVQNGLGYQPAWCKAHNAVFNAVLAGNTNGYEASETRTLNGFYRLIFPNTAQTHLIIRTVLTAFACLS